MAQTLNEDDLYRTSTQYRLWSFSPESLAALRHKTHHLALERAKRYNASNSLTPDECLSLTRRYATQLRTTSDHFGFPPSVKTTAVQYLNRFYLSNSPLTYPPKEIYKTVLWLACKTEATHMSLGEFCRKIMAEKEVVLAAEFKVIQALRFTLDVRQPWRGLKGVLMEMLNLAEGMVGEVQGVESRGAKELQREMLALELPRKGARTPWKAPRDGKVDGKTLVERVNAAYTSARSILDAPALLTDAYFLYTPSQLLLAALQLSDLPLTSFYLRTKLHLDSDLRPKILTTIASCAELLGGFSESEILSKDAREALEAKLEGCRDPGTKDLVGANARAKRGGDGDDAEGEEKARRKKAAREKARKEGEDLFGPSIGQG